MDTETEITNLKWRIQALETGLAGDLHREVADDLEALGVEMAALRWQLQQHHACGHSQLLDRIDDLWIGVQHLAFMLEEALKEEALKKDNV